MKNIIVPTILLDKRLSDANFAKCVAQYNSENSDKPPFPFDPKSDKHIVISKIVYDKIESRSLRTFSILCLHKDKDNTVRMSIDRLAVLMQSCRQTAFDRISSLINNGAVDVATQGGKGRNSNVYMLHGEQLVTPIRQKYKTQTENIIYIPRYLLARYLSPFAFAVAVALHNVQVRQGENSKSASIVRVTQSEIGLIGHLNTETVRKKTDELKKAGVIIHRYRLHENPATYTYELQRFDPRTDDYIPLSEAIYNSTEPRLLQMYAKKCHDDKK